MPVCVAINFEGAGSIGTLVLVKCQGGVQRAKPQLLTFTTP